ncbi:MAG: hypothetical protein ACK481_02925 [Candidatus Melainabacteria bacterium]|jgi:hypothetical protein
MVDDAPQIKILFDQDQADFSKAKIQPLDNLWNEFRYTRSTMVFLYSLINEKHPNKGFLNHWLNEVSKLKESLKEIRSSFVQYYFDSKHLLSEFEINKYDYCYLEIMFHAPTHNQ